MKLTDQQLKDLSILLSKVKSRKHGREVTVTLKRGKESPNQEKN